MKPSEVIAMRDKLAADIEASAPWRGGGSFADWLIESGWVTSEPERK